MKTPLRSSIFLASFSGRHEARPYPLYIHHPSGLKSEIPYAVLRKDDYTYISDKEKSTPKFSGVSRWLIRRRRIRSHPASMLPSDALDNKVFGYVQSRIVEVNNLTHCQTATQIYLPFDTQIFEQRSSNFLGLWTITYLRYYGMIPAS